MFCVGLFLGEFRYLSVVGEIIQGRYFLPVACGLASIVIHEGKYLRWLYICSLVVMNAALLVASFERYCGYDLTVLRCMLPF